jgi:hypothetical protein
MTRIIAMSLALVACGSSSPKTSDATSSTITGIVGLTQDAGGGGGGGGASAIFAKPSPFGPVLDTSGPCNKFNQTMTAGESAGEIMITGGSAPVILTPSGTAPNVKYAHGAVPDPSFVAGQAITFAAAGGSDIPAFSATVTAPTPLAGFTSPTTMISRSAGYTATWTAGSGPGMQIVFAGSTTMLSITFLVCAIPDTGSFTFTPAMLALLPSADSIASVTLSRIATMEVTAGDATVYVGVSSYVPGATAPFGS